MTYITAPNASRNRHDRTALFRLRRVFSVSAVEIALQFLADETLGQMADDLFRFVFSAVLLAILVAERLFQQRELATLTERLRKAQGPLAKTDAQSVELASQHRPVMQKQFEAWQLSPSEQDVVIGMLKGLAFRESAELRGTREKTARQQVSTVYRQAGIGGRNELIAWFFEDMLDPPMRVE
ncbi:MAG: hypothetical protein AAGD12_15610 [Pseudomonadota bacterium]